MPYRRGIIDPISLIGVTFLLISLVVGTNAVINHGSFDLRNWAASKACVHDTDCGSGYTCAESYTCEKKASSDSSSSSSSSKKSNGSSCKNDSECDSGYCVTEEYKCGSKSSSNSKNSSTSTAPVYNYNCKSGYYACNVGCCGVGGTPTEGKRYYDDSSNVWNASTPYNKLTDSQKKNHDQAMIDNGLQPASSVETNNPDIKTVSKMNQLSAQEIANFYADPAITDPQLAKIYCAGKTDPNCTNNFNRTDFISSLLANKQAAAIQKLKDNQQKITASTTNNNQTDDAETVAIGNDIANEDTASLFANPDITDSQLAAVYCVGKAADCSQNFKRTDFISSLPQDLQNAAIQNQKDNQQKKTDQNKKIYDKYVDINISDTTLAQEYCSTFSARGYASSLQCTKDFQRDDYLASSSLTDTDKLKAQGVYEENLTNELMNTNANYDTKVVLMQIVTKFQNSSISDATLAQDYCINFSAWGYTSKQDCTTKFKRSDYLNIADQLKKNLLGSPISAKSTTTQSTSEISTTIKTTESFCLDVLNNDCINGCIPDTSGGTCKTTSIVTPTVSIASNTNLSNCADATYGYCYNKNGQNIVYLNQGDPRWGQVQLPGGSDGNVQENTYSASACGQTTLAMILATYTDPGITPVDVVNKYYPWSNYKGTGISTAIDILVKKGYDVERLNLSPENLKKYIENGWVGFASISYKDRNDQIHTHFTLMVDVNSKGEFVYNDPYFGENTTLRDKNIDYTLTGVALVKPPKK
jgi:hypothetical protein